MSLSFARRGEVIIYFSVSEIHLFDTAGRIYCGTILLIVIFYHCRNDADFVGDLEDLAIHFCLYGYLSNFSIQNEFLSFSPSTYR